MPAAADDQMVVHGDAEGSGRLDDVAGDRDVGLGRGRVAGRVVVHDTINMDYRIDKYDIFRLISDVRGRRLGTVRRDAAGSSCSLTFIHVA